MQSLINTVQIIVAVVVHRPNRKIGYYGGTVAAPAARAVVEQTLEYLGVLPDNDPLCPTYPNRIEPPTTR